MGLRYGGARTSTDGHGRARTGVADGRIRVGAAAWMLRHLVGAAAALSAREEADSERLVQTADATEEFVVLAAEAGQFLGERLVLAAEVGDGEREGLERGEETVHFGPGGAAIGN